MDTLAAEQPSPSSHRVPTARKFEVVLLLLLVTAGLAMRLYNLGGFPDTLLADEADNAQDALRISYGLIPPNGFFGLDWTAQPAFSAYLLSYFIRFLGFSADVIRMPSALLSAFALVPFYLLLRRQFSVAASFLTSLLLASSVWYLNFSRSAWNNVHVCFYMLGAMLFMALALSALKPGAKGHRWRWFYFALAGAFGALGLYAYPSGRAVLLGLLVFFPFALGFYRRQWKSVIVGYVLTGAVAGGLFLPLGTYILNNWEAFNGSTKVVALVNSPEYIADPADSLLRQIGNNVRGPWDGSVNNVAQYTPAHEPQLDRIGGGLVLLGMILSLALPWVRRSPDTWLWWAMLLTAWVSTQVLTVGTPNGARGIGYVPALVYFAAITIDLPVRLARRLPREVGWVPTAAVAVLLLMVVTLNVSHYVDWQSAPRTRQDRFLYITAAEFPAWAAEVIEHARNGQGSTNVGQWRERYPIPDPANPPQP